MLTSRGASVSLAIQLIRPGLNTKSVSINKVKA